jgi:hypothetical protein
LTKTPDKALVFRLDQHQKQLTRRLLHSVTTILDLRDPKDRHKAAYSSNCLKKLSVSSSNLGSAQGKYQLGAECIYSGLSGMDPSKPGATGNLKSFAPHVNVKRRERCLQNPRIPGSTLLIMPTRLSSVFRQSVDRGDVTAYPSALFALKTPEFPSLFSRNLPEVRQFGILLLRMIAGAVSYIYRCFYD